MKKQILEVQNYFINKITACDFELLKIKDISNRWVRLNIKIDDFNLSFAIEPISKIYCSFDSDFKVEVTHDRLENLIELIKKHEVEAKRAEIADLQKRLKELL